MIDQIKLEPAVAESVSDKTKALKLSKSQINYLDYKNGNPWNPEDIDKMDSLDERDFKKVIDTCRFFYRHDSLSSTVINKMIDIGITDIVMSKGELTENEYRVFKALIPKLREFSEDMALEFLITGLVVPEYTIRPVTKDDVKSLGIKKYDTLQLPVEMWIRDPKTIIINKNMVSSKPSYFVQVDEETVYFILHEGKYADGTEDKVLFEQLLANFPTFVADIRAGKRKFLLTNPNILRRRVVSDTCYPTPFLYPAIESLKHKRNLRRMDYSIASRVITAIMLIRLGSDEFPLTEDDTSQLENIRQQLLYRNNTRDLERVYQLFANHTLQIDWVFPDTAVLLDESKYKDVNQDIIFALGFPKILITGETDKSNTSDAQYAAASPVKTLEKLRENIIKVLQSIVSDVAKANNFKSIPEISFRPLQLAEFAAFTLALGKLYETGNLSREEFANYFGYNFLDELEKRKAEQKLIVAAGVPDFAPTPNSRPPTDVTPTGNSQPAKTEPAKPKTTTNTTGNK